MLVDLVLPDIKKMMPLNTNIILQQDGANAHLQEHGNLLKSKVAEQCGGPNAVKLYTQPAQSPDLNVNSLGFFNSLQTRYYNTSPKNPIELIEMVEDAYKNYPLESQNRIWLSLQECHEQDHGGERKQQVQYSKSQHKYAGKDQSTATICCGKPRSTQPSTKCPITLKL
jgi:hypothetical protein